MTIESPQLAEIAHKNRREPVRFVNELWALDPAEISEGYNDGREGFPCSDNRSRAYWHGWRNGQCDSRRAEPDDAMRLLIADMSRFGGVMAVTAHHDKTYPWLKEIGLAD